MSFWACRQQDLQAPLRRERSSMGADERLICYFGDDGNNWPGHRNQTRKYQNSCIPPKEKRRYGYTKVPIPFPIRKTASAAYLIIPRSDPSINRISISTSPPRSASDRSLSSACDVFIFEASKILYA